MATIDDFSRLVQTIYAAAADPTNWAVALDGITTTLDATGCALLTTDRTHNEITVKSVGADPASMAAYNAYYGRLDPSPLALERVPTGLVIPNHQLVNRDK